VQARYKVLAMTVLLAAITYTDRVCISVTAPEIMRDLRLSKVEMSFVFSAFTLAYAMFEIPTGWWGDRVGTRRVLARIVAWWSTFTMLTGAWNSRRRGFAGYRRQPRPILDLARPVLSRSRAGGGILSAA
jgi:MFS family permease